MASEGVLATLQQGWHALEGVDAPKAVIGGLALTAWKHARYTRDADVLVAVGRQRVAEVTAALVCAGREKRTFRSVPGPGDPRDDRPGTHQSATGRGPTGITDPTAGAEVPLTELSPCGWRIERPRATSA